MWDPLYPVRTFAVDIRDHVSNYRRFKEVSSVWPVVSIATYVARFVVLLAVIIAGIWYGESRRLSRADSSLLFFIVAVPVVLVWFAVETAGWNYDLRRTGISAKKDIWKVSQFPEE